MGDLVLAVLAHDRRDCLKDLLDNLQSFAPQARVVLFNGGPDSGLTRGLSARTCPYSRPLSHHRVGAFHGLVMQWLAEEDLVGDRLVTLDSDVLLLKPGLDAFLDRTMTRGYMGAHLAEVLPDTPWRPGRRFHRKWSGPWQELFGLPHPWRVFNPGQVFARTYVEAFAAWPGRTRLMTALEQTRLDALDEIVWPTLAVTLGVGAQTNPGGDGLQLRRHSPREIARLVEHPDVLVLHKVGMDLDATDRRLVRELAAGRAVDFDGAPVDYRTDVPRASPVRRAGAFAKDVWQAVTPASSARGTV